MDIDMPLVRSLLAEQHPDLAELPLELFDEGWDNVLFHLGDRWLVRLPRREEAAPLVQKEQTWLPVLADRLPLPVPLPFRVGVAGNAYPWSWSVLPRFEGVSCDREPADSSQAPVIGRFLRALHQPAPVDAPRNPYRGGALAERPGLTERLERVLPQVTVETDTVRRLWDRALTAPLAEADVWIHGDLHARNVLVSEGAVTAVIDWGDLAAGDPATDLACAWMLFDRWADVDAVLDTCGASAPQIRRALGWVIVFAAMFVDSGLPDPYPSLGRGLFQAVVRYGGGV